MLPLISNLVAHWRMNDNSSDTVVADATNKYNGVWQHGNTSTDSITGKINRALNFDGVNDYVVVADNSVFNTDTFSFCAWLKHNTIAGTWDRILSKKNMYTDSNGYEITCDESTGNVLYMSGSSSSFSITTLPFSWTDGLWHHLVVVYSGADTIVYTDGVLRTTIGTITSVTPSNETLRLGRLISEPSTMWDGLMDDVRYYNVAINQSNVISIYNGGNGTELSTDSVNSIALSSNY